MGDGAPSPGNRAKKRPPLESIRGRRKNPDYCFLFVFFRPVSRPFSFHFRRALCTSSGPVSTSGPGRPFSAVVHSCPARRAAVVVFVVVVPSSRRSFVLLFVPSSIPGRYTLCPVVQLARKPRIDGRKHARPACIMI